MRYQFRGTGMDKIAYSLVIFLRSFWFLLSDYVKHPVLVIINREICPRYCSIVHGILERRLLEKHPVIWDFDDSILEMGEITNKEWCLLQKYADEIILLSEFHKKKLAARYREKSQILLTTDGDYQLRKADYSIRRKLFEKEIRLIWAGTHTVMVNLELVFGELERLGTQLSKKGKRLVLICVCDRKLSYQAVSFQVRNVKWSRKAALEEMKKSHIGIMPLYDNEITRGKGGFKLIQFLAAGLPIAGSDTGIAKEIISSQTGCCIARHQWAEALGSLCASWEIWLQYSKNARKKWEQRYSYARHLLFWNRIISRFLKETEKLSE